MIIRALESILVLALMVTLLFCLVTIFQVLTS